MIKKLGRSTLMVLLFIYVGGGALSLVYFNWQYARQHGFMDWLIFGEVVPSLKAVVWPYFVVQGSHSESPGPRSTDSMGHLRRSFELYHESVLILSPPAVTTATFSVSREDEARALRIIKEALSESAQVPEDFLASIHPDFPSHYEQEFREGLRLYAGALEHDTSEPTVQSVLLLDRFTTWYSEAIGDRI